MISDLLSLFICWTKASDQSPVLRHKAQAIVVQTKRCLGPRSRHSNHPTGIPCRGPRSPGNSNSFQSVFRSMSSWFSMWTLSHRGFLRTSPAKKVLLWSTCNCDNRHRAPRGPTGPHGAPRGPTGPGLLNSRMEVARSKSNKGCSKCAEK